MAAWEEAKKEIALIPDHPNRPPEGVLDNKDDANRFAPAPTSRRLSSGRGL